MSANRLKARRSRPPFVGSFKPGDTFRVECYDWKGGQIGNNDSASDVRDVPKRMIDVANKLCPHGAPCPRRA